MKKYWPLGLLALVWVLTLASYWRGLQGPFLFDDAPNLSALGDMGGVTDWTTLKAYVLGGSSGPAGRPLSLLSFLIDDNTWPSEPLGFKRTNLLLHLLCGLLLTWATYLLLLNARLAAAAAAGMAVLAASFWLLHPFFVSTTLYVVQRMTVLCALFMLMGLVGYLKGRLWLAQARLAKQPPVRAYGLMTASLGLGTVLAVLSKENGALLPLMVLVVEYFLRRMDGTGVAAPHRWWSIVFLWLPALAVVAYLARLIDFSADLWPSRPFNQVERLYSETRIIWDYLGQLWLPRVEGSGLYQDGFVISRSLTEPISTLWAVLFLGALMAALPWLYRRLPYVWLALVFFLCGHLIESTVVGLELHFEHRNYVPAFFMFLPLAVGLYWMGERHGRGIAGVAGACIIGLFAWMTWQRSELWSDEARLQTYWALHSPQSARGKNYLISRWVNEGQYGRALELADQAVQDLPNSSLMTMSRLRIHASTGQATPEQFAEAAQKLAQQPFDAQAVTGLRVLVDEVISVTALADLREPTLQLVRYLKAEGAYRGFPLFIRMAAYSEARLYLSMGDIEQAHSHYLQAMDYYGQAGAAMQMFAEMAGAGNLREARQMLAIVEKSVATGRYDVKPAGEDYYRKEIQRMQKLLAEPNEFQPEEKR